MTSSTCNLQGSVTKVEEMVKYLKENGVTSISKLNKDVLKTKNPKTTSYITKILRKYSHIFVKLKIRWRGGGSGIKRGSRFIKPKFLRKVFIGLKTDRTAIVRFFMSIFREDRGYERYDAVVISRWLNNFNLTKAERVAVVVSLGYKYSTLDHVKISDYLDNKLR